MARVVVVLGALAALLPGPAWGDAIVFRRGGDVWLMAPGWERAACGDGRRARAAGLGRRRLMTGRCWRSDPAGRLLQVTQTGQKLGEADPDRSDVRHRRHSRRSAAHVRLSPDGTRVAYDEAIDGDLGDAVDAVERDRTVVPDEPPPGR